jgi:hypothetical protein
VSTNPPEQNIHMTREEEQAAKASAASDESTEPADEGIGVHTDADDDQQLTEN